MQDIIPKIFEDSDFKQTLTASLVSTMKGLEYKNYLIDEVIQTPDVNNSIESVNSTGGGSKKLHSKTFKKIRKRKKERKRKQK